MAQAPPDAIRWAPDVVAAREASSKFGVPLILHFHGDACLPCRTLEQRVFSKPEVIGTMNRYFICVAVNATQRPEVASEFGVHSWPTDVFLAPDGETLFRGVSPQDVREYMAVLSNVAVMNRDRNLMLAAKKNAAESNAAVIAPAFNGTAQDTLKASHPELTSLQALGAHSRSNSTTPNYYVANAEPTNQQQMTPSLPPRAGVQSGPVIASQLPQSLAGPTSSAGDSDAGNPSPMHSRRNVEMSGNFSMSANEMAPEGTHPTLPPIPGLQATQPMRQAQDSEHRLANTPGVTSLPGAEQDPKSGLLSLVGSPPVPGQFVAASRQAGSDPFRLPSTAASVVQDNPYADAPDNESTNAAETEKSAGELPSLDGYCPIALRQQRWLPGSSSHAVKHRGKVYWMSDESAVQTFLAQPDAYAPAISGYDPQVLLYEGKLVFGSTQHGLFEATTGQVLLFSTPSSKLEFQRDFEKNMRALSAVQQRTASRTASSNQ